MGPWVCAHHLGRPRGSSRHSGVCEGGITNSFHIRGNQGSEREGDVPKGVQLVGATLRSQTRSDSDCPPLCFQVWDGTAGGAASGHVCAHVREHAPLQTPSAILPGKGLDLAPSWTSCAVSKATRASCAAVRLAEGEGGQWKNAGHQGGELGCLGSNQVSAWAPTPQNTRMPGRAVTDSTENGAWSACAIQHSPP